MPNYKYECNNCHHNLTEFQSMTEEPLIICPACGKSTLKRLIGSGMGVLFKGNGFYTTDYKKSSNKESCPAAKPEGGGCEGCPKKETK